MNQEKFVIGVDVGTGSARAGLFDTRGTLLATATHPIEMWHPLPGYAEQSSQDIWKAVCLCTRSCLEQTGIAAQQVAGISFDATCSLVVLDKQNQPLAVNPEAAHHRNIIVWMDQRAVDQTQRINQGGHGVLTYVGGKISPEMETPKLLWLKEQLPQTFEQAGQFFDLADYLTWRASGSPVRSLCTVACKWTYLGHENRWDEEYFAKIGLKELPGDGRIGTQVRPMGESVGRLQAVPAQELGLSPSCTVGVGIIDAHAGGLGLLGSMWQDEEGTPPGKLESALALIGGTSNCHMAVSREAKYVPGVWGPYYGAMVPGMWLTEGGQTTAGSAVDYMIEAHANYPALLQQAKQEGVSSYELLNQEISRLAAQEAKGTDRTCTLTRDIHVLPDFLGNRSPHADPLARGVIDGITLSRGISAQALAYYATLQGVAYGTRDIIAAMNKTGYVINTLLAVGGGTKNPLWLQEHADITGCKIMLPRESEAVLLGSAILAAAACGIYESVPHAMKAMSGSGKVIEPRRETSQYHSAKFEVFRQMYHQQKKYRSAMSGF